MTMVLEGYWGKASENSCHLLAYHSLDAVAVAATWLSLNASLLRALVKSCGVDETAAKAWTLFFIGLHDLGKWDARFQLKAKDLALSLNPAFSSVQENPFDIKQYNHGPAGFAWFEKECEEYGFEIYDDAASGWMRTVAGHHGNLQLSNQIIKPNADDSVITGDKSARTAWIQVLRKLFLAPAGVEIGDHPPEPPFLIAGFCSVCDWLASNEDFFPYVSHPKYSPEEYLDIRAENARRALMKSGVWLPPAKSSGMKHLYPNITERGVQTLIERLLLSDGLTIMEAPTGSGKTEAAIAYASRLLAEEIADGIIIALPTQATANAMLDRLEKIAGKLFPGGVNVVLAHGKRLFSEKFKKLKDTAILGSIYEAEASAQCARWIAESRKRIFLGQIGVCTIDQVLLSVLPVRHHFVRGFGVQKSVLIVDEAHAYDSYMNGLLDEVLRRQRASGGTAIVLSATLPSHRRGELVRIWKSVDGIPDANSYPLVTHASGENLVTLRPDEALAKRTVTVGIEYSDDLLPTMSLLNEIKLAVNAGAKVTVILNLVADAQALGRQIKSELGLESDIFHSRFRFTDRMKIEQHAINHYGKNQEPGGSVIVATQVIEQSLDLDFDWMITQICPVDLLFQRIGRLHRHERGRPAGFEEPRITVLAPSTLNFGGSAYVYEDISKLWRTQKLLEQNGELVFPDVYRELIEKVYTEEPWPDEPEEIKKAHEKFLNEEEGRRHTARGLAKETHPRHASMTPFRDEEDKSAALTRDGEMQLILIPFTDNKERRSFLDGRIIPNSNDKEYNELLNLNGIPVSARWRGYLPEADKGLFFLEMGMDEGGCWRGATDKALFTYHQRYGLEMKKK